jgi:muramoyltetrapeptide carboxypeptidase
MSRRNFLKNSALLAAGLGLSPIGKAGEQIPTDTVPGRIKFPRLKKGDKLFITAPGGAIWNQSYIAKTKAVLEGMGFKVEFGATCTGNYGQFSARDEQRAEELMEAFNREDIKGIISMRGGSGCARILDLLDFDAIKDNPKLLCGLSDITSLLNGIYQKTGLIGVHGPVGYSTWNDFTISSFEKVCINGSSPNYYNSKTEVWVGGKLAAAPLFGGNLTVFSNLIGTPYMPDTRGAVLFFEEISEEPYAIDRMLTQLRQAGVFDEVKAIMLGSFRKCTPEEPKKSLTLDETLKRNFLPLKVPLITGLEFGHILNKHSLPVGGKINIDTNQKEIKLSEAICD